jgi:hypothetical protein
MIPARERDCYLKADWDLRGNYEGTIVRKLAYTREAGSVGLANARPAAHLGDSLRF